MSVSKVCSLHTFFSIWLAIIMVGCCCPLSGQNSPCSGQQLSLHDAVNGKQLYANVPQRYTADFDGFWEFV